MCQREVEYGDGGYEREKQSEKKGVKVSNRGWREWIKKGGGNGECAARLQCSRLAAPALAH